LLDFLPPLFSLLLSPPCLAVLECTELVFSTPEPFLVPQPGRLSPDGCLLSLRLHSMALSLSLPASLSAGIHAAFSTQHRPLSCPVFVFHSRRLPGQPGRMSSDGEKERDASHLAGTGFMVLAQGDSPIDAHCQLPNWGDFLGLWRWGQLWLDLDFLLYWLCLGLGLFSLRLRRGRWSHHCRDEGGKR
jgi:hypothetical protein